MTFFATRHLLKSGSAGFHFLCESRYGIPNAPFFGLFPKQRCESPLLLSNINDLPQSVKSIEQAEVAHVEQQHQDQVEEDAAFDLFGGAHNAVTLSRTEVAHALLYCRAVVALCSNVPNSRDWLAGWAATITSNGDLVDCALQAPASPASVAAFYESLAKRRELSDAQRALVLRCCIYDAITAVVRARGATDLNGVEELIHEQGGGGDGDAATAPEGKSTTKQTTSGHKDEAADTTDKNTKKSSWIDSVLEGVQQQQHHSSALSSSEQHPLRPILRFARERGLPDRVVAEMFSVAMQELAVAEEKFSLIADGSTVSQLQ